MRPDGTVGLDDRVRVLMVTTSRQVWGAERSVLAIAQPLEKLGIDVVLGSPPGGDLEAAWRGLELPHVPLELPIHAGIRTGGEGGGRPGPRALATEARATIRTAYAVARTARPMDVVHSNSLWGHLDCALAGRLARRPVVLELHDLVVPGIGRRILSTAARLSVATVAVSTAVADVIGDGSRARTVVVSQAVDLRRFSPGPVDQSIRHLLTDDPVGLLVGIVGRIDPSKGVDVLIRAMGLLGGKAASARLVVVGAPGLDAGEYEGAVKRDAERLLGRRVRFVGPRDDVPQVLRALDVLVNASAAEPFGLSVLEAQACGIPVVAPSSGGVPDFVTDGDNGLLVTPGDPALLASALQTLLCDAPLRKRLGRRGRETAEAEHGLDQRVAMLAEVYRAAARREPVLCAR